MENHGLIKRLSIETLPDTNGLIKNLNLDMTQNILSHIPIEFVSRSRAVCKLWRTLLPKPKTGLVFAVSENEKEIQLLHEYNDKLSIDDAPISYKTFAKIDLGLGTSRNIPVKLINNDSFNPVIFGSCNGLVCLPVRKDDAQCVVYICNPMTGEYVYLPEVDFSVRPEFVGGFGYCQSTDQYKVVQVVNEYSQFKKLGRVQVYTLGDGSGWRNKGEICYPGKQRMVYAKDALYWPESTGKDWINVFDLADETLGNLPMPPCHDVVSGYEHLVSLSGCLCLCHSTVEKCVKDVEDRLIQEYKRLDMWILKKEQQKKHKSPGYSPVDELDDSNRWVWIKEFSMEYKTDFNEGIDYELDYEPFATTDNTQVLMWEEVSSFFHYSKNLICYDSDTRSRNELWNEGLMYAQAIPHMNTFVSLKDLGEKSAWYIPNDSELMHLSWKL